MTTEQLAFELAPLVTPTYEPEMTNAERFAIFHAHNPHVADALEHLAEQWLAHNSHVSAKALAERLRWEVGIRTTGEPWAINNTHVAFYARLLVDRRPEWASAFRMREQRAA